VASGQPDAANALAEAGRRYARQPAKPRPTADHALLP